MTPYCWSRCIYRRLLWIYPREFRSRFSAELESDFAQMLARTGRRAAWACVLVDLARSFSLTHAHNRHERRRVYAITLGGERSMGSLQFDLRHAVRALLKAPVFTGVTILTLALGIGANSAIFSLVNAVLLRPLGYQQPERLMMIHEIIPESKFPRFGVSPTDFLDLKQYQQSFTDIGAYRTRTFELSGTGDPEQIVVAQMSSSVFPLLGVNAAQGRAFLADEDQAERGVIVISDALSQRRFAGRSAVGERLILDRQPYTIVGVMSAAFQFPKRGPEFNSEPADVFMPLVFTPIERRARGSFHNHSVIGRLRDGVSMEQATADTAALAERIRENYPPQLRNAFTLRIPATPLLDEIAGQVRRPLLILLGAVGLVLLVACANVANLILSRAATRQREIGVRVALGAARHRLFQMLLIESLLLALAGGALGLLIGNWALGAMPAVIATSLPGVSDVTLDGRVLGFTTVLSVATAVVFGLVPLIAGMRRDVNDVLREGATRSTGGRRQHRFQAGLVVTSVAFAFVLLVGAGLLIRSFSNLMAVDAGLRTFNVLSFEVQLPHAGYSEAARTRTFYRTLHERLRAIPGVKTASISTDLPLKPDGERRAFTPDAVLSEAARPQSVAVTWTYGDYFGTFGVPLLRGRSFSPEEQIENRQVAIVSRALADRYWPGEDAIGKRIRWGIPTSTGPTPPWQTIVAIAGDVVDGALDGEPILHVYVPFSEVSDQVLAAPIGGLWRRMMVAVNGHVDAAGLATPARAAVTAIDPALAISDVSTMAEVMSDASAPQRFSATVLTAFAAGALLLAGIGLYGVLAFGVSQRVREIGVRLALGAGRREVQGLVLREGMTLAGVGLLIGFAGAIAATRVLRALLFETNVYDPWTFALVPIVLASVALLACYLPARRAARVDPMVALRTE